MMALDMPETCRGVEYIRNKLRIKLVFLYTAQTSVDSRQKGTRCEEREKNQQDAAIRCLLLTSVSTCCGYYYAHLQENKDRVTAFGVLLWFCSMWVVAVVGH